MIWMAALAVVLLGLARRPLEPPKPASALAEGGQAKAPTMLIKGSRYRGRVVLTGLQRAFAGESDLVEKFQALGFASVTARDLGDGAWDVEGTWFRETAPMPPLPDVVKSVVVIHGWTSVQS